MSFDETVAAQRSRDFPPAAAKIGTGRAWKTEDIVAHRDGKPAPNAHQPRDWLDEQILVAQDVADLCGVNRQQVYHSLRQGYITSDGRAGYVPWWWRKSLLRLKKGLARWRHGPTT